MEVKKLLMMPKPLWERIQEWRFHNRCETASEAMRRLIELGLAQQLANQENEVEEKKGSNNQDHGVTASSFA